MKQNMSDAYGTLVRVFNQVFHKVKETNSVIKKVKANDPYRIPPSLEEARLHHTCSQISLPLNPKKVNSPTDLTICPCCCQIKTEPYSLLESGLRVSNYGSTIPLYFHFTKYILFIFLIYLIENLFSFYIGIRSYCQKSIHLTENGECKIRLFTFYYFDVLNESEKNRRVNLYLSIMAYIALIMLNIWFYKAQKSFATYCQSGYKLASDYTVMIGNVKDSDGKEGVKDFIFERMIKSGLEVPKIVKINIASFKGNVNRVEHLIKEQDHKIKEVERHLRLTGMSEVNRKYLEQKKRIYLRRKVQYMKKRRVYTYQTDSIKSTKKNNLAFVTLNTVSEKNEVLKAISPKGWLILRCCRKKKSMKLMRAPEPDDINWEYVGYSLLRRRMSIFLVIVMAVVLFMAFLLISIPLYNLKLSLTESKKKTFFREILIKGISSMGISLTGTVFNKILTYFSSYEKLLTTSHFYVSKAKKLANSQAFSIIAAGAFSILVGYKTKSLYNDDIILTGVFYFFVVNIFFGPVLTFIDITHYFQEFQILRTTRKLENEEFVPMTQKELNELFDRPDCDIDRKYSELIMWVYVVPIYSFVMPICPLFLICYVLVKRWVEKILFMRRYRPPKRDGKILAYKMFSYCRNLPLLHLVLRFLIYGTFILRDGVVNFKEGIDFIVMMFFLLSTFFPYKRMILYCERKKKKKNDPNFSEEIDAYYLRNKNRRATNITRLIQEIELENDGEITFAQVCPFLKIDYDRENPLTKVEAVKRWENAKAKNGGIDYTSSQIFLHNAISKDEESESEMSEASEIEESDFESDYEVQFKRRITELRDQLLDFEIIMEKESKTGDELSKE